MSEFRGHAMAEIQGSWLRRMWLVARTLVNSQGLSLLPSTSIIQAILPYLSSAKTYQQLREHMSKKQLDNLSGLHL